MTTSRTGALVAAAVCGALLAGCGDAPERAPAAGGEAAAFPVTVAGTTIERRPERIVSLSPSTTETLFAVGAGDQVVAVDGESDYPPRVPRTDLSAFQPNVEAIADHRPDLVIVPDAVPRDVVGGLRRLGLTVLVQDAPADLDDAYLQMRDVGVATGHSEAGRRVARRVRAEVDALIADAPRGSAPKVFHELDPDLYSASSDTFIGRIYARLGVRNVADRAARRAANPYPQMSSEAVVSADPDLVVLADSECCAQTPAKVARRPGWDAVSAVRGGAVVAIDDDVASRWGPRIPLFVRKVVEAMERAERGAAR